MSIRIFISKGSGATAKQQAFVDAILDMLKTVELSPRIMYENEWSHEQPLKAIKNLMRTCDGIVVIAFTRTRFEKGIEFKKDKITPMENIALPTPWNHIEASIAYSYGLPLLVVAEKGLKAEGVIEDGYDWRVYWTEMDPEVIKAESFKGFLQSWKNAVEENKIIRSDKVKEIDFSKLSIGKLLNVLPVSQLWKLITIITTILVLVASSSYKLGAGKWPWQKRLIENIQPVQQNGTVSESQSEMKNPPLKKAEKP
jgi:hypothetical protein